MSLRARFQRDNREGVRLTDRDMRITEAVFEARYLTNEMVCRLFFRPTSSGMPMYAGIVTLAGISLVMSSQGTYCSAPTDRPGRTPVGPRRGCTSWRCCVPHQRTSFPKGRPSGSLAALALVRVDDAGVHRRDHFDGGVGAGQLAGNRMRALPAGVLNDPMISIGALAAPEAELRSLGAEVVVSAHLDSCDGGLRLAVVELRAGQLAAAAADAARGLADDHALGGRARGSGVPRWRPGLPSRAGPQRAQPVAPSPAHAQQLQQISSGDRLVQWVALISLRVFRSSFTSPIALSSRREYVDARWGA